jgi:hypothetical protein
MRNATFSENVFTKISRTTHTPPTCIRGSLKNLQYSSLSLVFYASFYSLSLHISSSSCFTLVFKSLRNFHITFHHLFHPTILTPIFEHHSLFHQHSNNDTNRWSFKRLFSCRISPFDNSMIGIQKLIVYIFQTKWGYLFMAENKITWSSFFGRQVLLFCSEGGNGWLI